MEKKLTEAFDSLRMDDACAEKIEQAMLNRTHRPSPIRPILRTAAAACLVLVMVVALAGNPIVAQAMENVEEEIAQILAEVKAYFGYTEVASHYVSDDRSYVAVTGTITDKESGETMSGMSSSYDTGTTPQWMEETDGRLYFTGNGEHIDITDLISYDVPFTYIYTDAKQVTHYIAIGGVYDDPEKAYSIGWFEFFRNAPDSGEVFQEGADRWIGGYGAHFSDPDTDIDYGWYTTAMKEMEIPW